MQISGDLDRILLSRPHLINCRYYPVRKSIPREYNYLVSSTKPISCNKPAWRHYALGLINVQTQAIIYPTLATPRAPPLAVKL